MSNRINRYYQNLKVRLNYSSYWDFYLSDDERSQPIQTPGIVTNGLIADFDFDKRLFEHDSDSGTTFIRSYIGWDKAINNGPTLNDIGLTGMDNGFIKHVLNKNDYTHSGFTNTFLFSTLDIPKDDLFFRMHEVTGMTSGYTYPITITADTENSMTYAQLCGGFYQGFYKLDGYDYQVLPNRVRKGWVADFWVKKNEDCEIPSGRTSGYTGDTQLCIDNCLSGDTSGSTIDDCINTCIGDCKDYPNIILNDRYPNNKGFFFYMGTRAENKFWSKFEGINAGCTSGCTSGTTSGATSGITIGSGVDDTCVSSGNTLNLPGDWCTLPKEISSHTSSGIPLGPVEITFTKYNNNFLIYNQACHEPNVEEGEVHSKPGGHTICNYSGGGVMVSAYTFTPIDDRNKFLTYNRTCTGETIGCYTGDTVETPDLDYLADTVDNALGFRITDDGRVGYRLLRERCADAFHIDTSKLKVLPLGNGGSYTPEPIYNDTNTGEIVRLPYEIFCGAKGDALTGKTITNGFHYPLKGKVDYHGKIPTGYTIQEEYSVSGLVKSNEWTHVAIRYVNYETYLDCDLLYGPQRKGDLMIYVNGKLKLKAKDFPEFIARRLNTHKEKQQAVPFNMSLGGGTQGLIESVTLDGRDENDKRLEIEQFFAGTFIGGIAKFRFYDEDLGWCGIKHNYIEGLKEMKKPYTIITDDYNSIITDDGYKIIT
jgi:hypothetical protein